MNNVSLHLDAAADLAHVTYDPHDALVEAGSVEDFSARTSNAWIDDAFDLMTDATPAPAPVLSGPPAHDALPLPALREPSAMLSAGASDLPPLPSAPLRFAVLHTLDHMEQKEAALNQKQAQLTAWETELTAKEQNLVRRESYVAHAVTRLRSESDEQARKGIRIAQWELELDQEQRNRAAAGPSLRAPYDGFAPPPPAHVGPATPPAETTLLQGLLAAER